MEVCKQTGKGGGGDSWAHLHYFEHTRSTFCQVFTPKCVFRPGSCRARCHRSLQCLTRASGTRDPLSDKKTKKHNLNKLFRSSCFHYFA